MKALMSAAVLSGAVVGFAGAASAAPLIVEGDLVRGAQAGAPGPACVLNSQFKHLEKVVFRFRVRDSSGNPLDDKGLKTLVVEMPDGQKFEAKYGPHPPAGTAADHFWTAVWIVPTSYPNGSLTYKAVATGNDGAAVTWQPFLSKPSQLQVVAGEIEIKKPTP
jgi:hypothetical protein